MSKFSKPERQEVAERDPTKCGAYGCKCRATVNLGSGWACFAHGFAPVDQWQNITQGLNSHDWLLGLVLEVRKMDRENQPWRSFATRFWEQSDTRCQPADSETAATYCDRMLMECLHRIGLSKQPPQVKAPRPVKPAGQFSRNPRQDGRTER